MRNKHVSVEWSANPRMVVVRRNYDILRESWCFSFGTRCDLSLVSYEFSERPHTHHDWTEMRCWDGMASQNQPKLRCDRPKSVPLEVAVAAWEWIGFPVDPPIEVQS